MDQDDRIFKRQWFLMHDSRPFLRAIIHVYERLEEAGEKTGSEWWCDITEHFCKQIRPKIAEKWAQETGLDPGQFIWSTDSCVYTWKSWRKAFAHVKERTKQKLGLPHHASLFDPREP